MNRDEKLVKAAELGRAAFLRGAKCVPYHDIDFRPVWQEETDGGMIPILDAWLEAWHAENLKANA